MKDLSDLPKKNGRGGLLPDAEPRFVQALVESWQEGHDENKPTALGTRFRHSDAGGCGRAITLTAAGIPASDPMDLAGVWNTSLGKLIHDAWQEAVSARWPNAEIEAKVATVGVDGSGHIDAVIRTKDPHETHGDREHVIAYELKSIGGYGYKAAIGVARKGTDAEGPKTAHILQAALNGLAADADEVVIGYLAKECVSVKVAASYRLSEAERFMAEWTIDRATYEPLALKEAERVAGLLALVDDDTLGRRTVPYEMEPAAEITEPSSGGWTIVEKVTPQEAYDMAAGPDPIGAEEDTTRVIGVGSYWGCDYCRFQSLCALTGPGRIPVAEAREAAVTLGLDVGEAA